MHRSKYWRLGGREDEAFKETGSVSQMCCANEIYSGVREIQQWFKKNLVLLQMPRLWI